MNFRGIGDLAETHLVQGKVLKTRGNRFVTNIGGLKSRRATVPNPRTTKFVAQ